MHGKTGQIKYMTCHKNPSPNNNNAENRKIERNVITITNNSFARIKRKRSRANQQNQMHTMLQLQFRKKWPIRLDLCTKLIKKNILGFEPYNERLCKLRIKGKFHNLCIISVYSPTEEKTDEKKENYYENLQIVHNKIPKRDIVIILRGLNAKIGKEEVYQNVAHAALDLK
jgi:hypothetical protein